MAVKLQRSQMTAYRHKLLREQNGLCAICGKPLDMLRTKGEGVLDHDHDTGYIRGLLHRSCNAAEGKVSNAAGQWGAKSTSYPAIKVWLRQLLDYWEQPQKQYIYPYHKTEDEKRQARNKKSREKRAAVRAQKLLAARTASRAGTKDPDS